MQSICIYHQTTQCINITAKTPQEKWIILRKDAWICNSGFWFKVSIDFCRHFDFSCLALWFRMLARQMKQPQGMSQKIVIPVEQNTVMPCNICGVNLCLIRGWKVVIKQCSLAQQHKRNNLKQTSFPSQEIGLFQPLPSLKSNSWVYESTIHTL